MGLALSGPADSAGSGGLAAITTAAGAAPHRYSLADFGLEPAVVDRRFARSCEWVSAVTLS